MTAELRLLCMGFGIVTVPALCWYYWHDAKELFPGALICWLGGVLNFLVVSLNGWQMPVEGVAYFPPDLIWKVARDPRLPWLCDRFDWGLVTYSLGDAFIYSGAVLFGCGLVYRAGRRIWGLRS